MTGNTLKATVKSLFTVVRERSTDEEIVIICPQPGCGDATGNRSVSVKNGKTSCWKCNVGGDFVRWARRLGYSVEDNVSAASIKEVINLRPEQRSILPVVTDVKLPEGFTKCRDSLKSVRTRLIGEMAVRKNLALQDMLDCDAGWTSKNPLWEPFTIFPVYEYGKVVYYQGRTYCDVPDETTKKFPSRHELKWGARYWIYNIDALMKHEARVALVVESILNVLSLKKLFRKLGIKHIVPVAVFKHAVSYEQYVKLSRVRHLEEVCMLFDHDAVALSWKDAQKFTNMFKITVAEMPAGEGNARLDPNDDVELAWNVFQQRHPYRLTRSLERRLFEQSEKTHTLEGDRIE